MSAPSTLKPIPVSILTGFLGSGKTTLLNRILSEPHGERLAVIENEFGETGIDHELLLAGDEQIVELNNGCLCCTVRGDLVRILGELADRRESGRIVFDRVLIETTGLADPGPVAQTFFLDEGIARRYLLDAVLTVVDAVHAMRQLDTHAQAQAQVGFADALLLSKTDLASAAQVEALTGRLRRINPRARLSQMPFGRVPLAEVLDLRGFNLDDRLAIDPGWLHGHQHAHDHVESWVFRSEQAFDETRLQDFLEAIARVYGPDLMRYKGVLSVAGLPFRLIVQGVHELMGLAPGADWRADEARGSVMVFIGKDLPRDILEQGLRQSLDRH